MNIDTDNLEALAQAASKGPWSIRERGAEDFFVEAPGYPDMPYRLDVCGDDYVGHGDDEQRRRNWDFIAAADPNAVIALIARLREAEESAAEYRQDGEQWKAAHDAAVEREQALAAHMERLTEAGNRMMRARGVNELREGCRNWRQVLTEATTTSLAHRDADILESWAGRLEELADNARENDCPEHSEGMQDAAEETQQEALRIRRQAEETNP